MDDIITNIHQLIYHVGIGIGKIPSSHLGVSFSGLTETLEGLLTELGISI